MNPRELDGAPRFSMDRTADGHRLVHAVSKTAANNQPLTVIVADDDMQVRHLVTRMIRGLDPRIQVDEATDGQVLMERIADVRRRTQHDPSLIILDLLMPKLDGWEVLDRLRREYESRGQKQGIPVIVVSGTSGEKGLLHRHSVHNGRSGYLPLVTVAKDSCAEAAKYYAQGSAGLMNWVKHFLGLG